MLELRHHPNANPDGVSFHQLEGRGDGQLRFAGMQFDAPLHRYPIEWVDDRAERHRTPLDLRRIRHPVERRGRPPPFPTGDRAPIRFRGWPSFVPTEIDPVARGPHGQADIRQLPIESTILPEYPF